MERLQDDLFYHVDSLMGNDRVQVLRDILEGLHHLHSHGIVHGDLKPENVLLDSNNRATLIDFENSHECQSSRPMTIVSPGYISPECARHESCGLPSDIWSFGIIVFVLYYKFNPYNPRCDLTLEEIEHHLLKHPFKPIVHNSCGNWFPHLIEPAAMDLIGKCLRYSPDSRWTTQDLLSHSLFKTLNVEK